MAQERNAFKVGLTLIAGLALFLAVMRWISSAFSTSEEMQRVRIRFPHRYRLPQLDNGSAVMVGGMRVGGVKTVVIEELPIDPEAEIARTDWYVVVDVEILRLLRLKADCSFTPEAPPLGGAGLLILELGNANTVLREGDLVDGEIPGGFAAVVTMANQVLGSELDAKNPQGLLGLIKRQFDDSHQASLMAKLHRSMDDFNAVSLSIRQQFDPESRDAIIAKLGAVMDNVNQMTASLRDQMDPRQPAATLAKVHAALDTLNLGLKGVQAMIDETRPPLQQTMSHLASTAETVDTRITKPLAEQLDVGNAAGLLAKINVAADRLNTTLRNVTEVSQTVRDVAVLNRDNLNDMIANLKQTSEQVKSGIKFVLRRPWTLFNAPTGTESKQKDILDAASNFQDAAARLDNATAELRALAELHNGHIPDSDADLKRVRAAIDEAYGKFKSAEASLWKQLDVK